MPTDIIHDVKELGLTRLDFCQEMGPTSAKAILDISMFSIDSVNQWIPFLQGVFTKGSNHYCCVRFVGLSAPRYEPLDGNDALGYMPAEPLFFRDGKVSAADYFDSGYMGEACRRAPDYRGAGFRFPYIPRAGEHLDPLRIQLQRTALHEEEGDDNVKACL
ncbi:hypothetical protein BDZ89DRAFT_1135555 [Hymenopellis radicata]|nr:hypothetical protein BDZ89DRAFT_1135550 [Hymenopellis radicata]KAF9025250.1 hypothetical protein BDZ89DRAFT_1135555 [Hymenopellis radicata]